MFSDTFEVFNTEKLIEISNYTKPDSIKSILNKPYGNYNDIPALISPNA